MCVLTQGDLTDKDAEASILWLMKGKADNGGRV